MSILKLPLVGRNLRFHNIHEAINQETHMIIFLRHLGCALSQQLVQDIKELQVKHEMKLPITFVSQGTKNFCDRFWEMRYPQASVIYDGSLTIGKGFGLKEGSIVHVLNPKSIFCSIRAISNGFLPGNAKGGSTFMLPGVFVYKGGQNVIRHISNHASDFPDFEDIVKSYLLRAHVEL